MEKRYFHKDLKKIFPWISPRTLISWSERGLVKPTYQDAAGRGSYRCYSYRNLIEVAFINELLTYGIIFSEIKSIMDSDSFKKIIKDKNWDLVFYTSRQIVSAEVPMDKSPPSVGEEGFCTILEFQKRGGEILFGSPKTKGKGLYTITPTSSAIIVGFLGLYMFVNEQIKRLEI